LLLRKMMGAGTPRALQDVAARLFSFFCDYSRRSTLSTCLGAHCQLARRARIVLMLAKVRCVKSLI
jgi:hypothetical protein